LIELLTLTFGYPRQLSRARLIAQLRRIGMPLAEIRTVCGLEPAAAADRYLLCSDGLSAVVDPAALYAALSGTGDPEQTAQQLIDLARAEGTPDNIACVVADFIGVEAA
jgi:serine/threonine protein phosphatase PrpC